MPYQAEDYVPPSLPELREIKNFHEVRDAVSRVMQYLQQLQAHHITYFTQFRESVNSMGTTESADYLPSVDPLVPTRFMNVVTGNGTITTINRPRNFVGQLMLVSRDGFFLASGGNVQLITSPNNLKPGAHIMLTWIPSLNVWVADTCRLQNTLTTLALGERTVLMDDSIARFGGGHFIRVGNFILASLTGNTVEINLPVPVADGPNWGGAVFTYRGITLSGGYSQLSLEADGGASSVYLVESGSNAPSQPVQPAQLDSTAQWRGTIWYRTT